MPTLANIDGASLVPNLQADLSGLAGFLLSERDKRRKAGAEREATKQRTDELGAILGTGASKDLQGALAQPSQDSDALSVLGQVNPQVAQIMTGVIERGSPQEIREVRDEATRNMKLAGEIQGADSFAAKQAMLADETARIASQGGNTTRIVGLSNLDEDHLDLEMQKMGIVGQAMLDAVPETKAGPLNFLSDPKRAKAFAKFMAKNPKAGQALLKERGAELTRQAATAERERAARAPRSKLGQSVSAIRTDISRGVISPGAGGRAIDKLVSEATTVDPGAPLTGAGKARSDFQKGLITQQDLSTIVDTPVEAQTDVAKLLVDQEAIIERFGADSPQAAAMAEAVESLRTGEKPKLSDVGGIRKEFTKLSGDFRTMRNAIGKIKASASDPSPAGDLALIFNYMKILDPNSVVRESEFATAENTGSIPDRVWRQYNKVLEGERLAPPMRADFVDTAGRLFASQAASQTRLEQEFIGIAERANISPQDVIVDSVIEAVPPPSVGAPRVRVYNPATRRVE